MRGWTRMLVACTLAVAGAATTHARQLIVGGSDAPAGSWPSIVALVIDGLPPSSGQFCGGTLIDPGWVLTAAHCTFDETSNPLDPARIDAVVGITDLSITAGSQRIQVSSIVRHPQFDVATLTNDVALLELASPAVLTANPPVAVMDLAAPTDRAQWEANDPAQIAGWGRLNKPTTPDFPSFTDVLQQASIAIVSDADCLSTSSYGPAVFKPAAMVCAGLFATGGVDACNGDSGGPLVVTGLNGTKVLVGATSFTDPANPCGAASFPAVYTRLDTSRSFVYGPQGVITGVSVPGAPNAVTARAAPGGANVSWSAPAANGRAIAGYRITTRRSGILLSTLDIPATVQSAPVTGLTCGSEYSISVAAANAAGLGPESIVAAVLPPAPLNVAAPVVAGISRLGRPLTASSGTWNVADSVALQWHRETAPGSGAFAAIPGATGATYVPRAVDVSSRLSVAATAANGSCSATAKSSPIIVLPPFRVASIQAPKVAMRPSRIATVALRLRTEARTRLTIKILDDRGKLRTPVARASRIAGRPPGVSARRLIARLGAGTIHPVTVAFRGWPGGAPRTVRIVIVATTDRGERATTTVRARVRSERPLL